MKNIIFFLNLAAFAVLWLAITGYTLLAIFDPNIPYSLGMLALFVIILDLFAFPLLYLWWKRWPNTIAHQTWALLMSAILIFYWGFATIHSFLSLNLDSLQLRWVAFAYIWEVVIVGALAAYLTVRVTRFAQSFLENDGKTGLSASQVHERIATTPLRASAIYIAIVFFGYSIGSVQLVLFSKLPLTEVVKNLTTGFTTAALSAFFIFFILERILEPAAEKSGKLVVRTTKKEPTNKRLSLYAKIYAVSGLLALIAVGFFGTMAFTSLQRTLENDLRGRIRKELEILAYKLEGRGETIPVQEVKNRFGPRGSLEIIDVDDSRLTGLQTGTQVLREKSARIIGSALLPDGRALFAMTYVGDFDRGLSNFLWVSVLMFFMIMGAIALISTLFARSITAPVERIKNRLIRLGVGDFAETTGVYTNDDLEDVGLAIDNTASKLQVSYMYLEEAVRSRTKEVARTNDDLKEQVLELEKTAKRLVKRDFQLQEANERLREIDDAKTHFVSVAAHQLRTPLSAIKWALHMMLSGDLGEITDDQKKIISEVLSSTSRLINLVGDLLNVARIESGQLVFRKDTFVVEKLISDLIKELAPRAEERGIALVFHEPENLFPPATGDRDKLMLALMSIAENALNYTDRGGRVEITLRKNGNNFEVAIRDTGIGIPEHQQHMLFQKFFRADNVVRKQIAGTGIALYITSRIIKAHKGTITVVSKEGVGSTFTVSLPFQ